MALLSHSITSLFHGKKSLLTHCSSLINTRIFFHLKKLHQLQAELPVQGSYFEASFPFSTNPDGFDTHLSMNIKQPVIRTNLAFTPFVQAEQVDVSSIDCHLSEKKNLPFRSLCIFIILAYGMPFKSGQSILIRKKHKCISYLNTRTFYKVIPANDLTKVNMFFQL